MRSRCELDGDAEHLRVGRQAGPGPTPNITRPRVMWSSWMMRSATISGLWYGSEITPVPSRMRRVRSAAAAMNSSGEAMIS